MTRGLVVALLAVAIALAACGGAPVVHAPVRIARDEPVPIDVVVIDDRPLLAANVRVNGTQLRFWIDTGAGSHVLFPRALEKIHLATRGGTQSSTFSGVRTLLATAPIDVIVSESMRTLAQPASVMFNVHDAEALDGLLSPQSLVPPEDGVMIDPRAATLSRVRREDLTAVIDDVRTGGSALEPCPSSERAVQIVRARVGDTEARLLVDTGAPNTILFADSIVGDRLGATSDVLRVAGGGHIVTVVPNTTVRVGGLTTPAYVLVDHATLPDSCDTDGVLGLDVLRACRIVLSERGGALSCRGPIDAEDEGERLYADAAPAPTMRALAGVTQMSAIVEGPLDEIEPSPSPDGTHLVYDAATPGEGRRRRHVEVVAVATPSQRFGMPELDDGSTQNAIWLDADTILYRAYAAHRRETLFRADVGALQSPTVVRDRDDDAPYFLPCAVGPDRAIYGGSEIAGATHVVKLVGDVATDLGPGVWPVVSPDGSRIVYSSYVDDVRQLFAVPVAGGAPTQLTHDDFDSDHATYTADGRWIVYDARRASTAAQADGTTRNLFATTPDGTRTIQLTDGDAMTEAPRASSDGWLYFTSNAHGTFDVWRLRFDGNGPLVTPGTGGVRVRLTVTASTGIAVPVGTQTELTVWPVRVHGSRMCHAHLRFGTKTLYGTAARNGNGDFSCHDLGASPPVVVGDDVEPSSRDEDPAFRIDTAAGHFSIQDDADGPNGVYSISGTAVVVPRP